MHHRLSLHLTGYSLTSLFTSACRDYVCGELNALFSFPSDSVDKEEEEGQAAAEAPAFTSQTSTVSVTSSEPTGTDSHCEEHVLSGSRVAALVYFISHVCSLLVFFSPSCCERKQ